MPFLPFPEFRPDCDDYRGQHTQVLSGVMPRGDGYGPVSDLQAYSQPLPSRCCGYFYARKTDGSIVVFASTAKRLFRMDNTTLTWIPVSRVIALTSISNASPAVFTLNNHGLSDGDTIVLVSSGTLPAGLTANQVYYVVNSAENTFEVSETSGGAPVDTTDAGTGTHSMTYVYSTLPTTDQWQFAQFGNIVLAVQANEQPQAFDLATSVAFADLGGSPPPAKFVSVVGRFLVLSGLTSEPIRIHWSDLDGITTWTAGTGFSNYVDLPDGGVVRGSAGGEFGVIFQENVIRRMVYVPGAKPAFQIERITEDEGLLAPYSVVRSGNRVGFLSQQGFREVSVSGLTQIGKERVDRTILEDIDLDNLRLMVGASDPSGTRFMWGYKSLDNSNGDVFNKMIAYDYVLERWSPPFEVNGEFLSSMIKPGMTLESLDDISSSIDALPFTLDSISATLESKLSAFDDQHRLGFFDGGNVAAVLETPEQGLDGRQRMFVSGFSVRTDAPAVYGSIKHRSNAQAALSETPESSINDQGFCPQRVDTKFARAKVRIPAGTNWTYCMGVDPEFTATGLR